MQVFLGETPTSTPQPSKRSLWTSLLTQRALWMTAVQACRGNNNIF